MSEAQDADLSEKRFLELVATVCAAAPPVTPMGASVLLALHFGICQDSRTFARMFDVPHALVLREVTTLSEEHDLVTLLDRNPRTQRTALALGDAAQVLLSRVLAPEVTD